MDVSHVSVSPFLSLCLPSSLSEINNKKKKKRKGWHCIKDRAFELAVRNLSPVLGPSVFRPCDLGQVTLSL